MKSEFFLKALNHVDDKYIEEARENNMKKRFNFKPIIAVAACAALALAAVPAVNHFVNTPGVENPDGNDTMFTVYESEAHDSTTIGNHKIELVLDKFRDPYIDASKKNSKGTVTLNGLKLEGTYEDTDSKTDYREAALNYEGISNGKKISFSINEVTGKCESFLVHYTDQDLTKGTSLTRDELYEIAYENFMDGGYTDDPENYTLSAECDQGAGGYWFKFSRFIGGIETREYVMICTLKNGEFFWFNGNRIGEMKDVDVSGIDMDKFYAAVETKLKAIYADAYVGFDKNGAVLTKLTDGSYVFDYAVDATVKNDKGEVILDRCYLTVLIDK